MLIIEPAPCGRIAPGGPRYYRKRGARRLLTGAVPLATAWIAHAAIARLWPRKPRTGSHSLPVKSWFRSGFEADRQLLRTDPLAAVQDWLEISKPPRNTQRVGIWSLWKA